jgi:hypothetical protein
MKILFEALKSDGHDVVYWIGENGGGHMVPEGAIFHDHYEAWDGKPAQAFARNRCTPPSLADLHNQRELESLVLTMMNKRYDQSPTDERKQIYFDMLAYWREVLEVSKPEAVIFTTVPHSVYDYILYSLASTLGLRTLMFEDSWVAGRLIWFKDYRKGSEEFARKLELNSRAEVNVDDLHIELQKYYRSQTGQSPIKPAYMVAQESKGTGLALLRHRIRAATKAVISGQLPSLAFSYMKRTFGENLRKEYSKLVVTPDLKTKFVYFPLGFQPERTTSPQGGDYCDQILVAQTLAAALPSDWKIYIKEHPSQWWLRTKTSYSSSRYKGYYKRLAQISNVYLVPIDTSSHELIARAQTVATVTGTAGWEALFRFKKPLIFGFPWYLPVPHMFKVKGVDDCKKAFAELERSPYISEIDLLRVLKSFEESSMAGYVGMIRDYLDKVTNDVPVTAMDSYNKIARIMCSELREPI